MLAIRWLFETRGCGGFLSRNEIKPLHARLDGSLHAESPQAAGRRRRMEGMKNNIVSAEHWRQGRTRSAKYVDRSYFLEALKELDRR
jgi:hypothetical protein